MKDSLKAMLELVILFLLTLILLFSIAFIGVKYSQKEDERKYNGGVCECGGNYVYQQAVAHAYDTDYIYICDKCGRMIELETYRAERKEE